MKRKTVVALLATMALTAGGTATAFAMNAGQFSDVKAGSSYYSYIETVVDAELMNAESEEEFGVAETETRGKFIRTLHTLAKSPLTLDDSNFEDVKGTDIALAVRWAENEKLFEGLNSDFFAEGKFDPDKELTREEMAVILYNYGKYIDGLDMRRGVGSYDSFSDHEDNKVSDTYAEQVKWAVGNKLLTGDDRLTDETENNLRPTANINRVEVAEALYQYISLRDMLNAEKNAVTKDNDQSNTNENAKTTETPVVAPKTTPVSKPAPEVVPEPETPDVQQPDIEKPDNGETAEPEKPHNHTWVDNMVEVKYEEEGHWEKVEVKPAWVETVQHEAEYKDEWVVDKEAEYKTVHHEATYEKQWVVDKEAEYKTVHHEAEYQNQWIVDKKAWTEYIEHAEEGEYQDVVVKEAWDEAVYEDRIVTICNVCGAEITGNEYGHLDQHLINEGIPGGFHDAVKQVQVNTIHHPAVTEKKWVVTKAAWTEEIPHAEEGHFEDVKVKDAWDEQVKISDEEGHFEDVKVKDAWDEQVLVAEEEGHFEKVVSKEAWTETIEHDAEYEDQWVVDQEAYTEWVSQGDICSECGETR